MSIEMHTKQKKGRPCIHKELTVKAVRFPKEVWDSLSVLAKSNRVSVSQLIREGTDIILSTRHKKTD